LLGQAQLPVRQDAARWLRCAPRSTCCRAGAADEGRGQCIYTDRVMQTMLSAFRFG